MFPKMSLKSSLVMLLLFTIVFSISDAQHHLLGEFEHYEIPLPVVGPESVAFDCSGAAYAGVADGRILKWLGREYGWGEFATTSPLRTKAFCDGSTNKAKEPICGRPLGLMFHPKTCELYIADAYFGLLKTGHNGGLAKQLVKEVNGIPLRFTNDLDVNPVTGMVYFTDSSTVYERRQWELSFSRGDRTGRLIQYNPATNRADLLRGGLSFPNGVAASLNGNYVLVTQTTGKNILRYWVRGPRAGNVEVFARTQGFPDNVKRNIIGEFWVAENANGKGKAVKFDAFGNLVEAIDGFNPISHVQQYRDNLWIGSIVNPFVGVVHNIH